MNGYMVRCFWRYIDVCREVGGGWMDDSVFPGGWVDL